ncbi:MAG: hypothetical protein IIV90_04215, partial [Oscillospiraceae bacterium]|nr:hypothetical protein [Oscillospiraceae bacterium]
DLAGEILFESGDPLGLFRAGLAEQNLVKLSGVTVLVPQGDAAGYFAPINQQWQKQLSAFFPVKELPLEEVQAAVAGGGFQIALLPISASDSDPLALLQQMAREAPGGWADAAFAAACAAEEENYQLSGRAKRLAALEQQLILACPVAPLYHEAQYLLADPAVKGLVFSPFGPTLDVTGASR